MAKSASCFLSIIVAIALVLHPGHLFGAEKTEIQIELKFDKKEYAYDEPIGVKVGIFSKSGKDLLLSRGFMEKDLVLEIRIIDPAGHLIFARQHKPHDEFPDAPPLPFVLLDNKEPVRAVPCEVMKEKYKQIHKFDDIKDFYALERPGKYTAQVQVSAAIFKDSPCHTKNYRWLGVLKSNTVHFDIGRPFAKKKQTARGPSPVRNLIQKQSISNNMQFPQFTAQSARLVAASNPSFAIRLVAGGGDLPTADMTVPTPAIDVPVDTAIGVNVGNAGSNKVVKMHVQGTEVYNTEASNPDTAYPHTRRIPDDSSPFTLTYQDPQTDYAICQQVDVQVIGYKRNKPDNPITHNFSFQTICPTPDEDSDGDGISDETEDKIFTRKEIKTLFVRPKTLVMKDNDGDGKYEDIQIVPWTDFRALYPGSPAGFADIPAFAEAKIEISVIGDGSHPYPPMRAFDYDPATDVNRPACDILEVFYLPTKTADGNDLYCTFGHHNFGHTYFSTIDATWFWDTKGYVPNDQTSPHYLKYQYFTPLLYSFPLDKYFKEGAYDRISMAEGPRVSANCGLNQCYDFNNSSPLNINSGNPVQGRPDDKVEFNPITFNSADKKITFVGSIPGVEYEIKEVLRRTLVHEMGHALLAASELDHCNDYQCIMYQYVEDWGRRYFGPPEDSGRECTHGPGGSKDIRASGVIHNRVH